MAQRPGEQMLLRMRARLAQLVRAGLVVFHADALVRHDQHAVGALEPLGRRAQQFLENPPVVAGAFERAGELEQPFELGRALGQRVDALDPGLRRLELATYAVEQRLQPLRAVGRLRPPVAQRRIRRADCRRCARPEWPIDRRRHGARARSACAAWAAPAQGRAATVPRRLASSSPLRPRGRSLPSSRHTALTSLSRFVGQLHVRGKHGILGRRDFDGFVHPSNTPSSGTVRCAQSNVNGSSAHDRSAIAAPWRK